MTESLLIASFVAGFLTVLAPCLLPLLPVVVGGSVMSTDTRKRNPYIIIGSLLISIVLFTLIIEGITTFIYVPQTFWTSLAGVLILLIGIAFIYPGLWTKIPGIAKLATTSNRGIGVGAKRQDMIGDSIIGLSLGPAFSSCSPTYLIILAVILPGNFLSGLLYLIAYVIGLGVTLLFIALIGQSITEKLGILAGEKSWFRITIGIVMLLIAIAILTGFDKEINSYLLDLGLFDATQFELDIESKI